MTYAARRPTGYNSVRSYQDIGLETEVLSATPERLITLLYRGARAAIAQARLHLEAGRIAERGQAISKATRIVDEGLKLGLNREAGGDLAANLSDLYDYIIRTLLKANLHADAQQLDVADQLLADLASAWETSVDPATASSAPV